MHKLSLSSCLAVLLFSVGVCHAQTGELASPPDGHAETTGQAAVSDCDGWEKIASDHWNNRVRRLGWKYPDAPYFGDLPKEVQDFLISKYCEEGVDWVSDRKAVVRDIMQWKWPAGTAK